jgi:hypothetical protein
MAGSRSRSSSLSEKTSELPAMALHAEVGSTGGGERLVMGLGRRSTMERRGRREGR